MGEPDDRVCPMRMKVYQRECLCWLEANLTKTTVRGSRMSVKSGHGVVESWSHNFEEVPNCFASLFMINVVQG